MASKPKLDNSKTGGEAQSVVYKDMQQGETPSVICKNMQKDEAPSVVHKNMQKEEAASLVYTDMQKEEVDEVVEFLHKDFFQREPLARGLHLTPEDIQDWFYDAVQYWQGTGVSVVARQERPGAPLVGVLLSLVLTKDGDHSLLVDKSTNEKSRMYGSIVTQLESSVNVYELLAVDRVVELSFLSVKESFGGRGIGARLCKESEQRGQVLGCQAATVQATNIYTQRIFDKLGYRTIAEIKLSDFSYGGVPCIDPTTIGNTTTAKMMARKFT